MCVMSVYDVLICDLFDGIRFVRMHLECLYYPSCIVTHSRVTHNWSIGLYIEGFHFSKLVCGLWCVK